MSWEISRCSPTRRWSVWKKRPGVQRDRGSVSPSPGLYLASALLKLSELGLPAQSVPRGDPGVRSHKLVPSDFVAELGFAIAGAGVEVGRTLKAQ